MRMTFAKAREVLRLPSSFLPTQHDSYDLMLAKWKEEVVEARRKANVERETELNEAKAFVKKRKDAKESMVCPSCGKIKNPQSIKCQVCWQRERNGAGAIMEKSNVKLYQIEEGVPVPSPRGDSELSAALKQLERLGQSFCTPAKHCTIILKAKQLGVKVLARVIDPNERNKEKRVYRVWRSDGLTQAQLNDYIAGKIALNEAVELAKQNV